jgi:hypothetical protein
LKPDHPLIQKQDSEDNEYNSLLMRRGYVNSEGQKQVSDMHDKLVSKRGKGWCKCMKCTSLKEDSVPVNAAGSGGIAGIGTGPYPQSEPGVPKGKKRLRVILNKAKMLTRTK